MEKHIFISYNRNDADFAEILINRIKVATNFETWIDSEKIDAGEDWRVDIDQAIENAFALIVIMTPDAKASEYVTYEWSFAWGAKVKVIPIVLKPVTLHPRLAILQHLDFTNHASRPWNKLMDVLKRTSEEKSSSSVPLTQDISSEQVLEAAKALVKAIAHNSNSPENAKQTVDIGHTKEAEERIHQLIQPGASKQISGASILWVDDRPENNYYERQALESLGINFTLSTSTEDALNLLSHSRYDLIISDMGRPPDSRAGYTLLQKIRDRAINTPFVIYAGSKSPEHVAEARRRGAIGTTNAPGELFDMVIDAIKNS